MTQPQSKSVSILFVLVAGVVFVLLPAQAENAPPDGASLFKAKCAMCHGADGKKAAGHYLSGADVQKESDADLTAVIADGKPPKMPKYGDKLKPEEIKGLVTYIRTLKK